MAVEAHDENGDYVLDINEFTTMQVSYWEQNCKESLGIEEESSAFAAADAQQELKPTFFYKVQPTELTKTILDTVDSNGAQLIIETHLNPDYDYLVIQYGGEEIAKYDISKPSH